MSITQQYISSFDSCSPIEYKGLVLRPFTVRQIRECAGALHCLSVDPIEFRDLSLLPLKRLDFILTIMNRKRSGQVPADGSAAQKYDQVLYSFQCFISTMFPEHTLFEGDPMNKKRKRAITLIDNKSLAEFRHGHRQTCDYVTLNSADFEDMADLILYQNAVDISWKDIPPSLRQEAGRMLEAMAGKQAKQKADTEQMIDIAFLYLRDMELVMNLPVRKFYNLIDNIRRRQDYEIYSNPMYTVKDLKHWMFGGYNRSPYAGILQREEDALREVGKINP